MEPSAAPGAIYRRLGVEPIVNGRSTFTVLGGSLMPPEVLDAMRQAAACFVDLTELQIAVGRRLAELTRNEAAFVSGGAAAGLFLSAAACMARRTRDGILRHTELETYPREFVIHRAHRVPYDAVIELAGGQLVDFGPVTGKAPFGGPGRKTKRELGSLLTARTAAIVYVPKPHLAGDVLPLPVVVEAARQHGVPVIVDAAAHTAAPREPVAVHPAGRRPRLVQRRQGPARPGQHRARRGQPDWIRRVPPTPRAPPAGAPMKAGKEDLSVCFAAVEWYLAQDEAELIRRYEAAVDHIVRWGRNRGDVVTVDRGALRRGPVQADPSRSTSGHLDLQRPPSAMLPRPPSAGRRHGSDLLSDEGADPGCRGRRLSTSRPRRSSPARRPSSSNGSRPSSHASGRGVFLIGATGAAKA
jgi:L-seryl-tRNA(Ser) seleniumtransferase